MSRRGVRFSCALLIAVTLLAACGRGEGSDVNESLTEGEALTKIYAYLDQTVEKLPPGVGFALKPDSDNLGALNKWTPVPCYDGHREHGPWQVQLDYWVVGIPPGTSAQHFDSIRQVWTDLGWRPDPNATPTLAGFETPDSYTFVVQDAELQPNGLSITAASPCFPDTNRGGDRPDQPTEIKRP